ncbi:hypothetical protein [Parachlamydia sp. AcF125]|uniref:hypothetical protein n=1 Tax=Parachlamydia sp. AcF125 TaxID=2795736 RepID=UPI001BC99B1C|nr:hypothetical protein [Parachlamydia sp. AcF125]MBS4169028.1 hypothetical protein [Parachlamydia sp. AcF125]
MAVTVDFKKRDVKDHSELHDYESSLAQGSPLLDENGNPCLRDPIELYLEKLGEQLREELAHVSSNDERLLNLALSVLMLMFRKSSRFDQQHCQDTFLEIKYQGVKIRDSIDNWKKMVPSIAAAALTIASGFTGLAPAAGGAFKAVHIIREKGTVFNTLTGIGSISSPLGAFGQGAGSVQGIVTNRFDAERSFRELRSDRAKQKQQEAIQSSSANTQKCDAMARKIYELLAQHSSVFTQMAGGQS